MSKPIVIIMGVTLAFLTAQDIYAQNFWTSAGSDNLWDNPDNWSLGVVPGGAWQDPDFGWDDPAGPFYPQTPDNPDDDLPAGNNNVMLTDDGATTSTGQIDVLIDSSVHAFGYGVRVGRDGSNVELQITGGILDIGNAAPNEGGRFGRNHFDIGRGFNKSGDPNTKQRVVMTGGTVNTNLLLIPEQFVDNSLFDPEDPSAISNSAPLNGELIMSGGTMNALFMNLGQLKGNGTAKFSGDAVVNLVPGVFGIPAQAGHLEFNRVHAGFTGSGNVNMDITDNAIINIFGHLNENIVAPDASELARYQAFIDSGELTANNGTGEPTLFLGNGVLKICALDADYDKDCDVDEDDLAAYQASFGSVEALKADGDSDNDEDVDGADFLEWQREFGVGISNEPPPPFLLAVPEPTSLGLALLSTIVVGLRRQRCSCLQ